MSLIFLFELYSSADDEHFLCHLYKWEQRIDVF